MVALDPSLDDGVNLRGRPSKADYQVGSLHSAIYWENPQAYSSTGSPPNGADYVALRDGGGTFLKAAQVKSLEFKGAKTHALLPVTWQVDPSPPAAIRGTLRAPIGRQPTTSATRMITSQRRSALQGPRGAHVRDPLWGSQDTVGLQPSFRSRPTTGRRGRAWGKREHDQVKVTIRVPTPISWQQPAGLHRRRRKHGTTGPSISLALCGPKPSCSHCAT